MVRYEKSIDGHDNGTLTYANGDTFVGRWYIGIKFGNGTQTYANGDTYVGNWYDGQRYGKGTLIYADGSKYIGRWQDGEQAWVWSAYFCRWQ